MYMYCRIHLDKRGIERVHDGHGDMCDMSRRQLLRWRRGPARCMHMRSRLLFGCWCCHDVRGHERVVCGLHGRKLVRWGQYCPCVMHMCRGVLFGCWCCDVVLGDDCFVHSLHGWQFLRW